MVIAFALSGFMQVNGQIQSTLAGGVWSDGNTWIGGIVPGSVDNVVINGTVSIDLTASCNSLTVASSGILQNHIGSSSNLNIFGSTINEGTIRNNIFNLVLYIHGDLYQNGIWKNFYTGLVSPTDQSLYFYKEFSGTYLNNTVTTGKIVSHTSLGFEGTSFDMNNDTLYFEEGNILSFAGGYLDQCKVISENGHIVFKMSDDAIFQKCSFFADTIQLNGIIQFQSAPVTFNGTVINSDTLRNYSNSSYSATIKGTLINYGYVTNNVNKLNLTISGDLYNYGYWNTNYTYLSGVNDQKLYFYSPVRITNFIVSESKGKIISQTDLNFTNSNINLENDTLIFDLGHRLSLSNSILDKTVIINDTSNNNLPFNLYMDGNSQLKRSEIVSDSIFLNGTVQVGTAPINFQGNLIVEGTLQNYSSSNYSASVFGNLINDGTIKNNNHFLDLYVYEDIIQNSIWENNHTFLSGATKQNLILNKAFGGSYLTDINNSSDNFTTTNLIFFGTEINLDSTNLYIPDHKELYLNNGSISECTIISNAIDFALLDNSYCQNIILPDVTLYGTINIRDNVIFLGNVFLKGTLQNDTEVNCNLVVPGDLRNNGNIKNNVGNLTLTVNGNHFTNGSIQNEWILLKATEDQEIELQNGHTINGKLMLSAGNALAYEWYKDGNSLIDNPYFTGATSDTLQFLSVVDQTFIGLYKCLTDIGWSREISIDTISNFHELDISVFLEGPFHETAMQTGLNETGNIPLSQPYNSYPWYYPGNEVVENIPNSDIVDWVFVELKDAPSSESAGPGTVFDKQAAFLLKDGKIVGTEGTGYLFFYHNITDSLFINIRHRNHLAIMSATALVQVGNIYSFDFRSDSLSAYGGSSVLNKLADLPMFIFGMIGGDGNSDGKVNHSDKRYHWKPFSGLPALYDPKDLNQDGQVDNQDKNEIWVPNLGKAAMLPE